MPRGIAIGGGSARRGSPASGFALVEVTLALLLIALLAALALPGLVRATGPGALRVAAMDVSALLRDARTAATNTGRATLVATDGRVVRSAPSGVTVPMPAGAGVSANVRAIRFWPDGHSSGGAFVLATQATHIAISVSPDTGAIRVDTP